MVSNCNCGLDTATDGQKGITIWQDNNVSIGPNQPHSWSFTDTKPDCYDVSGQLTQVCLINYEIATNDSPQEVIKINRSLNGYDLGSTVHSPTAGHNITETYDLAIVSSYVQGGTNTVTFTNTSSITVQINNFRVLRVYAMRSLDPTGQGSCNPAVDTGASGSLDYSRQDYPCNYAVTGDRVSYVQYDTDRTVSSIGAGQTATWQFQHPNYDTANNYAGPYACLVNFNNVYRSYPFLFAETHYVVRLNGYNIADYYHAGYLTSPSQFPSVDLAKSPYYDDRPNAWNTVQIYNDGSDTLHFDNGTYGGVDFYRFYKVLNVCKDDFSHPSNYTNDILEDLTYNGGSVSVTGDALHVTVNSGGGWGQAGKVTRYAYDATATYPGSSQQGFEAAIDVTDHGQLEEMQLLISDVKVNNQDPASLNNFYRIMKNKSDATVKIQRRFNGGSVSTTSNSWASSTGQLKIKVVNGNISFYENGILRGTETFALPSNKCFIYAYTSSNVSGTGIFDNFVVYPGGISRIQSASNSVSYSTSYSVTLPQTPRSGNTLIAVVGNCSPSGVATSYISQSGVTWSQAYMSTSGNNVAESEIWVGIVGDNASSTLTLYATGSSYYHACTVCEYHGLSASPLDICNSSNGYSNSVFSGTSGYTAQANELWIGALCGTSGSCGLSTPTNGFSMLSGGLFNSMAVGLCEKYVSSRGYASVSATTCGSPAWAGCIATFKASN